MTTPRILYGVVGAELPSGDLYRVPGLENRREGVKKVLNALLFSDGALSREPRGTKASLPKENLQAIRARIQDFHRPIAYLLGTAMGFKAQFIESQIHVKVLLDLAAKGVAALPIHDDIVVKQSAAEEAETAMRTIFNKMAGVGGLISREDTTWSLVSFPTDVDPGLSLPLLLISDERLASWPRHSV